MGKDDQVKSATAQQISDVMIVPLQRTSGPGNLAIFFQNYMFALQWQRKDPANRVIKTVPVGAAPAAFAAVVEDACKTALGRTIFFFVGHGGIGGAPTGHGGVTVPGFDSLPEVGLMSTHKGVITQEVMTFQTIAEKNAAGHWVPKPQPGVGHLTVPQSEVDSLSPRFEALLRVAAALRSAKVRQFYVLACNIGNDRSSPDFATMLQGFLGVPVRLPKAYVAVGEVDFTVPTAKLQQIWFTTDHDHPDVGRPPSDDRTHPSFSEVPTSPVRDVP